MAPGPGCLLPLLTACGVLWGLITAKSPITAWLGGHITLTCLFPSQPGMDLRHLTLTWKKEQPGAEPFVVHSYYNGREQLARQAEAYRNWTELDSEGMAQGITSLTLRSIHTQDEGVYRCYVHSQMSWVSEKWELRLEGFIVVALPVTAPMPITALSGEDVTLSCLFPSKPGMDLQNLTLTWLKERAGAATMMVHSYDDGRDQLARQAKDYRNRTWLDPEGLARGNASLILRDVHTQDEGIYRCYVFSNLGRTLETIELTVNETSHILVKKPGTEGNPTGQSHSQVWLLIAVFGAWTLLVIIVTRLFCPPSRGTCIYCSKSYFAGSTDADDPSPQIQLESSAS